MKYERATIGDVCVIRCAGRLDSNSATTAESHLMGLLDEGVSKLLLDFERVDFISSMGMRVLLTIAKRLHAGGGALRICCLKPMIVDIFHMSGFIRLLYVFDTEADALKNF